MEKLIIHTTSVPAVHFQVPGFMGLHPLVKEARLSQFGVGYILNGDSAYLFAEDEKEGERFGYYLGIDRYPKMPTAPHRLQDAIVALKRIVEACIASS